MSNIINNFYLKLITNIMGSSVIGPISRIALCCSLHSILQLQLQPGCVYHRIRTGLLEVAVSTQGTHELVCSKFYVQILFIHVVCRK